MPCLLLSALIGVTVLTADRYGQPVGVPYEGVPERVTDDAELRADAEREGRALRAVPAVPNLDPHGGLIEPGRYFAATGFFRIEKVEGRWWFITPEGHRFFLIGCDACGPFEGGYSTPLVDLAGQRRPEFAGTALPSKTDEAEAWMGPNRISFLVANLKRKYGPAFRARADECTQLRLKAWGFNSTAKWGWGWKIKGVPFFEDANIRDRTVKFGGWPRGLPMTLGRYIDIYHPALPALVERLAREKATTRKGDSDLIAYSLENENGWNDEILAEALVAPEGQAGSFARRAFFACVARLRNKRPEEVFSTKATCFSTAERQAFFREASLHYHQLVADIYHRVDPDHLFIAEANCGSSSDGWLAGLAASPVDFVAFHEYALEPLGWYGGSLAHLEKADKPFAILEFSFTSISRGMASYNLMTDCVSQQARGLAYRHYTEQAAVHPLCLGLGYFLYYDQPFTRRQMNGECHNFGLVNQQDRPYTTMIEEVKKANGRLFALHAGARTDPFPIDDTANILAMVPCLARFRTLFERGSMDPRVACECNTKGREALFRGHTSHLKINQGILLTKGRHWFGTVDLQRQGASAIETIFYCYRQGNAEEWPCFEGSSDGHTFLPLTAERVRTWKGEHFSEWRYRPQTNGHRYVRIGVDVKDPLRSWLALLAEVTF